MISGDCPWCGSKLPASKRECWFNALEHLGIDPLTDNVPSRFQPDAWYRSNDDSSGAVGAEDLLQAWDGVVPVKQVAGLGKEATIGRMCIAPFGNRTGNVLGELPH